MILYGPPCQVLSAPPYDGIERKIVKQRKSPISSAVERNNNDNAPQINTFSQWRRSILHKEIYMEECLQSIVLEGVRAFCGIIPTTYWYRIVELRGVMKNTHTYIAN